MATAKVDVSGALNKLDLLSDTVAHEARVMVAQAAEIGAEVARKKLISSTTKWGEKRFAMGRGASAGRDDTGSMIADLQAHVSPSGTQARFGWTRGMVKPYYKFQEYGTTKIKAALSLFEGRTTVLNELPRLEHNMKQRIARKMK